MKAYIASGWFSPLQENARQELLTACREAEISVYSPKEDFLYIPDLTPASDVFTENVRQILNCDFLLASTEGKDMGTLFECGFAFANKIPIVYYYKGEGKFNLMLSESAHIVCTRFAQLCIVLYNIGIQNEVPKIPYEGEKE